MAGGAAKSDAGRRDISRCGGARRSDSSVGAGVQWAEGARMSRVWVILWSMFAVGAAGLYVASRKVEPAVRRSRLTKFVTYFCIVNFGLLGAFAGHVIFGGMMLVVAALGGRELVAVLPRASGGRRSGAGAVGAAEFLVG